MKTPEANPLLWNGPVGMIEADQLTTTLGATLEVGETPSAVIMTANHEAIVRGAAAVLRSYMSAEELPGLASDDDSYKELPKPRELIKYFQDGRDNVASIVASIPWLTEEVPISTKGRDPLKFVRRFNVPRLLATDEAGQVEQLRMTVDKLIAKRYDKNNTGVLMIDSDFPDQVGSESLPAAPLLWNMAIELAGNTRPKVLPEPALAEALASGFITAWESIPQAMRGSYPPELYDLYEAITRARVSTNADIAGLKRQARARYGDTAANRQLITAEEQRIQKLHDQLGKVAVSREILEHLNTQNQLFMDATAPVDDETLRRQQQRKLALIGVLAIERESAITYNNTVVQDPETLTRQAERALEDKDTEALADAVMALNEQRQIEEPGAHDALLSVWDDAIEVTLRLLRPRITEISKGGITASEAAFINILSPKSMNRNEYRKNATIDLQESVGWAAARHFGITPQWREKQSGKLWRYTSDLLDDSGRQLLRAGYVYDVMRRGVPYGTLTQKQLELQARILAERTNRLDELHARTSERSQQQLPGELRRLVSNVQKLAQKARGGRFGRWLNTARARASNVMQPPPNA